MPVVLDATVGGANANSFTTVAKADAYHANQLYSDAWTVAPVPTDAVKAQALITATRLIVSAFNTVGWAGWSATTTQRLPVPRSGMQYPNGANIPNTIIPADLEDATAEMALKLIEAGMMPDGISDTESQSVGLKRLKVGSIELEFDHASGGETSIEIPESVFAMISYMFESGTGRTVVPLYRA